VLLTTAKIKRT